MTDELAQKLKTLADKYENTSFYDADPSQFLKWYKNPFDIEPACFIAAMLSFGNRKQFIPKIREIFETADKSGGAGLWLKTGAFSKTFPKGQNKFYRFYSYDDMHCLFGELSAILKNNSTFGDYLKKMYEGKAFPPLQPALQSSASPSSGDTPQRPGILAQIISDSFPESAIVPKGKNSANKRIHMFLRWMVRQSSPVDLGLWSWYPQSELLIPLDVHVMEEGINLGLLPQNAKATFKTAVELSEKMSEIFQNDPSRADYALFGLGVDTEKN